MKTIIVNGHRWQMDQDMISYREVVALTCDGLPNERLHSVTYRYDAGGSLRFQKLLRHGFLTPGQTVECVDGMVFKAYVTGNA